MTKLPKHLLDTLQVHEWKEIEHHTLPEQSWAKAGVALSIYAGRRMKDMYHVSITTPTKTDNRFINIDELRAIIER